MSIRESLGFSQGQKRGFLPFLFIILFAGIMSWQWSEFHLQKKKVIAFPSFKERSYSHLEKSNHNLVVIDINQATAEEFQVFPGIGEVISNRIIKFRESKKGFKSIEDLKKVYGLKPEVYLKIAPYLSMTKREVKSQSTPLSQTASDFARKEPNLILDINLATPEELQKLPGIGETLSRRWVKFRESKGGFNDIQEIKKIYGLSSRTFERIEPHLVVNKKKKHSQPFIETDLNFAIPQTNVNTLNQPEVVPLDINLATEEELIEIPGIGEKTASNIVKYRKIIGFYDKAEYVREVYGMRPKNLERMIPYLYAGTNKNWGKVDLNTVSTKKLSYYPYINMELASVFIQQRRALGRFESWKEVEILVGPEAFEVLRAYFFLKEWQLE